MNMSVFDQDSTVYGIVAACLVRLKIREKNVNVVCLANSIINIRHYKMVLFFLI